MNTALDALRNGFGVTVDSNAVRAVELEPGDGQRALEAVRAAGGSIACPIDTRPSRWRVVPATGTPPGRRHGAHHGSESYFVIGEGLLSESAGGARPLAAAEAAPPFRFSRMGPRGVGAQLPEGVRKKLANVMTAGGGGPAGSRPGSPTSGSSSTTT